MSNNSYIIPLYTCNYDNISKLLDALDSTDKKIYVLVEGKFDLPWYKKCLNLLGVSSDYILLPAGGENNADSLKKVLEELGKKCLIIKDGDTNSKYSIAKDCIELYTPLNNLNEILDINLSEVPIDKDTFFNTTIIDGVRTADSVKRILANNVDMFLTINNQLVSEVKELLNIKK